MKKYWAICFLLLFFIQDGFTGQIEVKKIKNYLYAHGFNESIEESNVAYRGIFNGYHLFTDFKRLGIYLVSGDRYDTVDKYFFPIGNDDGKISSLGVIAFYDNKFWVFDDGNRVTLFLYKNKKFVFKSVFYVADFTLITAVYATKNGLYIFGKDYDGVFHFQKYSYIGVKRKEIFRRKAPVPGNIIISSDDNNRLIYAFEYDTKIYLLDEKSNSINIEPIGKIHWKIRKKKMIKDGIVYNVGILNDRYVFETYWTSSLGGILEIIDIKKNETVVTLSYPLVGGYYSEKLGSLFIYRESFQDKSLRSFLLEVKLRNILK